MNEEENGKKQWFAPKRTGIGITPRSWQGWLFILLGILVELAFITIAHNKRPSWFKAKTNGSGFTPVSWEGWFVSFVPIAVLILIMLSIYFKQRKE